tara:strand:- start:10090 stop:11184 length:1095 start_codon:yes stop_codon:yes gene_type:complete
MNSNTKNKYIILVESNGNGHITQMINIIKQLSPTFECGGIIVGNNRDIVNEYGKKNNIPVLCLKEPEYVSELSSDKLISNTLNYIIEYSLIDYKKVSKFVNDILPGFIINLHLPLKLASIATRKVFNISSQNRLNFDSDYNLVISNKKYSKFMINSVIFSSYIVHNSYLNLYKISIDCVDNTFNKNITIPPLINIEDNDNNLIKENMIVCYFNIFSNIKILDVLSSFNNITFYVYLSETAIDLIKEKEIKYCSNIHLKKVGTDFQENRKKSIGVITSCGVETVYENFYLKLPMICIPSNAEQLYNAYDHSRKVPGFKWTYELSKKHIDWIINFKYSETDIERYKTYCNLLKDTSRLKNFIKSKL